jgi:hypothetical protein
MTAGLGLRYHCTASASSLLDPTTSNLLPRGRTSCALSHTSKACERTVEVHGGAKENYITKEFKWDACSCKSTVQVVSMITFTTLLYVVLALPHVSQAGIFGRPSSSVLGRWGGTHGSLSSTHLGVSTSLLSNDLRGGSTDAEKAVVGEEEGEEDTPTPLYLPGLLTASVVRSNTVRLIIASRS